VFGGALIGAAVGLKLTCAPYGLAVGVLGIVILPRLLLLVRLAAGLLGRFLISAGPWMVVMWQQFRNPFFPLLKGVFKSPYASQTDLASDPRWGAHGLGGVVFLPF
jgi:hypothetical protein